MNSTQKFYLETLPYEKSIIPKTSGFKFDMECKKWYTNNPDHPIHFWVATCHPLSPCSVS